ncbi:MAG: hypothetical protein ACXVC6_01560, partial [Bacteroidia bacterium]
PLWDRDAKYIYYAHGPLARVELGEHHVQGMDYAYTLQGWIKAVNSEGLQPAYDMGRDGLHDTSYNANVLFAKDAFGYSLTYYSQDYSAIGWTSDSTKRFLASQHYAPGDPSDLIHYRHDLFNGNIGTMVTSVTNPGDRTAMGLASSYKYDQLNRIVEANSFDELLSFNNIWNNENWYYSWESFANNNRFKYDANGNILEQVRKDEVGRTFDSLLYRYKNDSRGRLAQNRLYHVNDTITASMMNDDIDDEGVFDPTVTTINTVNNYSYDKIGNLVRDSAEGIATIDWTVYGKMKSVTHRTGYYKLNGTDTVRPPDLVFNYDAAGNRVSKIVKPRSRTGVLGDTAFMSTYYVRDAQGNILSTYTLHDSTQISALYFKQTEKHIYGSSRLGMERTEKQLIGATFSTDTTNHYLGNKQYELSNHLGNVVTTVSDKKIPKDTMEVITVYSSPDAARASIDSLGGLKIYPQAPWGYSGMNFVFPTITGQNYKIDFYLNLANTDPDSVMGHWPAVLYPDNTFNDLNHTGHYSLTWNATDTITAIKACYLNSTDGLHYFMFDSLKITKVSSAVDTFVTYNADIKSVTDYYAFGAPIQGRTWSASSSVYGMNGQEKDDEIAGTGNIMTAEHWEYDSRIGRRWNLDPVDQKSVSNYATFKDNPILYSDPNGASATDKKLFDRETGKQVGYQKDANGTEFVTEEYGHFKDGGFISEMTITPDQRKAYDDIAERTRISRLPSPAQKAIYAFADQAPKVIFGTAAVVLAAPVAVEVGLFSATGSLATSVAGGSADFLAQMTFNGGNIKKVNWTNVAASAIFKNPLTSAAIGSVAEGSIDKGFNNSLLFGNKTLKTATIETTFGTLGNIVGGKGGTIGGELFDMGGRGAGKIFGETFGNYQGQFLGNSLTKASGQ